MKTNTNTPSVIAIPDAILKIAELSVDNSTMGGGGFEVLTNLEHNGVEFQFTKRFYSKPLWNYLKSIGFTPMAKKHMLYLSPKKVSEEQYRMAYLVVRKLRKINFQARNYEELYISHMLDVSDHFVQRMMQAAYHPETKKPAKQASKSRKSTKATKSKATAKAVALPQVAEDLYDIFR